MTEYNYYLEYCHCGCDEQFVIAVPHNDDQQVWCWWIGGTDGWEVDSPLADTSRYKITKLGMIVLTGTQGPDEVHME